MWYCATGSLWCKYQKRCTSPVAPRMESFRRNVQRLAAYFYAGGGILALTWATRLQQDFDKLTELFNLVGLRTNVANMVIMACQPYNTLGFHLAKA